MVSVWSRIGFCTLAGACRAAVADTIGKGLIDKDLVTPGVVFGALVGAMFWNVVTWLKGIPSSSSHALIGGLIGIVLGLLISQGVAAAMGWPVVITTSSIVIAFAVCSAIGIFFGWYPARKASNLNPIDALRYE